MLVCEKCRVVMAISQTGVTVRWDKLSARSGDVYQCPVCGKKTIECAAHSYVDRTEVGGATRYEIRKP